MKSKIISLLFLAFIFSAGHAQKHSEYKCQLSIDKESGRDVYEKVDSQPVFADKTISDTLFITKNFKFKVSPQNHKDKEWVQFAYIVEKDGKVTFLRVISPKDDKEIEEEAKRIVSLMPLYEPARCEHAAVPTLMKIRFQMRTN